MFPADFWTGFKVTDLVIAVAAAGAVGLAFLQWRVYVRQAKVLEETKKIAEAGLSRPHVLVESVSYRTEQGAEGRLLFYFDFQLRNYGNSPAIIKHIVAFGFISSGRRRSAEDKCPATVFPEPGRLDTMLGDRASVRVFPQVYPDSDLSSGKSSYFIQQSTIVLRPGKPSPVFSYYAGVGIQLTTSDKLFSHSGSRIVDAAPWLIGRVMYLDVFGVEHKTNFCKLFLGLTARTPSPITGGPKRSLVGRPDAPVSGRE
jgi:hypothetical protein